MRPVFLLALFGFFCTQGFSQNAFSNVAIRFPDDIRSDHCPYQLEQVSFYNPDSLHLVTTVNEWFITQVPDACILLERDWLVYNADFYNPALGCIHVPNPQPSPSPTSPMNLPGAIISAPGTSTPWTATLQKINPADPLKTDYAVFYTGGTYKTTINGVLTSVVVPPISAVNCFLYHQTIKVVDTQAPLLQGCPAAVVIANDSTQNDADLWNAPYWQNPFANGNDLDESSVDLSMTATDSCGLYGHYFLFLDLDGNGVQETVINSNNLPPAGQVYFGNALLPNYSGGELRHFDQQAGSDSSAYQFGLYYSTPFNNATAVFSVRWNTQQNPGQYVLPQLPAGTHRIKWIIDDPCGNTSTCDYNFTITNQTTATGQAAGVPGFQLFPNSPNPFSAQTWIRFQLPEAAPATLQIRDLTGRLVFTKTEHYAAGLQIIRLDESDLPAASGPLFCSLRTERHFALITLLRM